VLHKNLGINSNDHKKHTHFRIKKKQPFTLQINELIGHYLLENRDFLGKKITTQQSYKINPPSQPKNYPQIKSTMGIVNLKPITDVQWDHNICPPTSKRKLIHQP
jgi:hypothetical protein